MINNKRRRLNIGRTALTCLTVAALLMTASSRVYSQSESDSSLTQQASQNVPSIQEARNVNENSVGIVFHFEDYYRRLIDDMGRALQSDTDLRVIPVIGVSHLHSVYDQLYLKGIDLSIIHSDVLEYLARTQNYERVFTHINSLGTLYREKIAIIANSEYQSLADLDNQEVNFGFIGKGSDLAGTLIFDTLKIDVVPVRFEKFEAIEKVKSGELAATIFLLEDAPAQLKMLSPEENVTVLPIPNTEELLSIYSPETFDNSEFPMILEKGESLRTLSTSVIIASYNWQDENSWRYQKLNRFVTGLLANIDLLESGEGYEETWKHVSFDADVPGVRRLPMVQTILDQQAADIQRLADQKLKEELQQIIEAQNELVARLNDRIAETDDPEELESLLAQLQQLLDGIQ